MLTTTMQQLLDIMFFHYVRIMIVLSILVLMIGLPLYYLARYKGNIQKRMKQMETRFSKGMVYRDNKKNTTRRNNKMTIRCMELDPNFVKECSTQQHSWQLLSLGQYLSTLQLITENNNECQDDDSSNNTNVAITKLLTRELEATIGGVLLKHLGRNLGAALLPMLGITQFESVLAKVATNLASWVAAHILVDMAEKEEDWDPTLTDRAAFPFTLAEIISFANLNQKIRSSPPQNGNNNNHPSSLEWMRRGEIGYDPSFAAAVGVSCSNNTNNTHSTAAASKKIEGEGSNDKECNDNNSPQGNDDEFDAEDLIPNPFIVEEHFEAAIYGMEGRMRLQQEVISATRPAANAERTTATTDTNYDPEDRSLPPPTPIDERLLPGLHMGWGDAKCTHTKREIIRNRLFACLLNKLSYNYYRKEQLQQADNDDDDDLFVAKLNGKDCKYPDELIQALLDSGHTIQICPRSCITTFGIAACVKEDDGTWSNIPIGFFFRTGFERFDGRPAYFVAPHGGLDMSIEGPLVGTNHKTGKSNKCDVQFYVAIEGMCGWHSNHNADVPWVKSTSTTDIYDEGQSLQAVRMAGLLSTTFNSIATEVR